MVKLPRRHFIAGAAGLALAAAAGFGPAAAQDKEALHYWIPLPLTGPLAVTGQAQQVGWEHAIDWINKNGGIEGHPIEAEFYDDEYKVELGVSGFKKAVADQDLAFSAANGTPFIRAISPENNETHKVLMSSTGGASDLVETDKYKYHFLVGPTYSDQVKLLFDYIKENFKGEGEPKVAIVYSASEFGRDPLENARRMADEMGIDIVLEQETKWVEVDVTSHAIRVRQAQPDYVIFHGYAANVWPEIVKLVRDYGVETQFMGTLFGSHPDVVGTIGDAADNYLGTVSVNLLVGEAKTPMMETINEYLKTWTEKPYTGYANIGYMQSWSTALVLKEAIGSALKKGLELNGENLIAEINAIEDFDAGGVFGMPISFVDNRIPYGVIYRYNTKDGKLSVTEAAPWQRID
ncbi:ABC transporter substrate-binding protein [Microbaculum marinum]|uniref:ABC transporter substrate-binding protein n=1 Tax=Microbaculum marinum TaxID=1764581 RepID=A0AAW9RRZ5_9HYPH